MHVCPYLQLYSEFIEACNEQYDWSTGVGHGAETECTTVQVYKDLDLNLDKNTDTLILACVVYVYFESQAMPA